jgi:hypothetical protein
VKRETKQDIFYEIALASMEYCQRAGPSLTHVPTVAHMLCQRILKILPDRRARDPESQHAVLQNSVGGRDLGDYFDRGDGIVTVRTLGKRRSGTTMPVPEASADRADHRRSEAPPPMAEL